MKIYTSEEYATKLHEECMSGPDVKLGKRKLKAGKPGQIKDVKREIWEGKPVVVLYMETKDEQFGVIMDRRMADDLTSMLGPHPLVEEYFRLN